MHTLSPRSVIVCGGTGGMVLMVGGGDTRLPIIVGEVGTARAGVLAGVGTVAGGDTRIIAIPIIITTRVGVVVTIEDMTPIRAEE